MPLKQKLFGCFLLLLTASTFHSQTSVIDSLKRVEKAATVDSTRLNIFCALGREYRFTDPSKSLVYYSSALALANKLALKNKVGFIYHCMGLLYLNQGSYPDALQYFLKALKVREAIRDTLGIANSLNRIGLVYYAQQDFNSAKKYYGQVLEIGKQSGDTATIAMAYGNLGSVYKDIGQRDEALKATLKALKLYEALRDSEEIAGKLNNIGLIYIDQAKYDLALANFLKSLAICESIGDKITAAETYVNIGFVYEMQGNYNESVKFRNKAVRIAREVNYAYILKAAYAGLITSHIKLKDPQAEKYFDLYTAVSDSIYSSENAQKIAEMQTKYETEKKEQEIQLQNLRIGKNEAELKKQQTLIYSGLIGLIFVVALTFFIYRSYMQKKKANLLLASQNAEIQHQKALVDEKNKNITDSINYAKRIQEAILPTIQSLNATLKDGFVLYLPKDIVAGDFYWMEKHNNRIYFAAADCTGHGVPGALVSVICSNALSKALLEDGIEDTGKLLDRTRDLVISRFAKSDREVKDGMDISLCSLDMERRELQWSGANNPLWIIRKGSDEIVELKPDKQPIGTYAENKPFTTHNIRLQEGDTLYVFTDGYADQFGGADGKKFKYKQLKDLLVKNVSLTMHEQREKLKSHFESWRGTNEQVDDVCVIGLRV